MIFTVTNSNLIYSFSFTPEKIHIQINDTSNNLFMTCLEMPVEVLQIIEQQRQQFNTFHMPKFRWLKISGELNKRAVRLQLKVDMIYPTFSMPTLYQDQSTSISHGKTITMVHIHPVCLTINICRVRSGRWITVTASTN